ncbi:MAG TPA: DNA-3-methyladenine glycosylase [Geminicoccus sp.]|jgi:DNA-3-methyladenine glycosylase|uniref:DNA-3-methyladenine glycosylase n=1 Tax=Geminicoccus sp. TaxID=2024832 RepID=UPI002E30CD00|nr:DNA-3-methyladenine glycosylase [Geminicoccus sp.]HEX2526079.1 DNA-3-methyladenine glycosylase [Geminicoccus sp.]
MISSIPRLSRAELPVTTVELARWLIGKTLVHGSADGLTSGRIVETEAYVEGDASSHAFRGPTQRNRSMFLRHGHAYVYFIYGSWYALNISAEAVGVGAGVLFRALEPLEGVALMQERRRTSSLVDLCRGPGRLATAMAIDRQLDGLDMCGDGPLWLGGPVSVVGPIGESVRIGISKEAHRVLRFFERGSPFVSGPKRLLSQVTDEGNKQPV